MKRLRTESFSNSVFHFLAGETSSLMCLLLRKFSSRKNDDFHIHYELCTSYVCPADPSYHQATASSYAVSALWFYKKKEALSSSSCKLVVLR